MHKLLQRAVAKLLEAIYEQDFLSCSYGYRRGIGALNAIRDLTSELNSKKYHAVVEADIKGFFNAINQDLLLEMLLLRIDDKPLMNLISKWLKAGILETDGQVLHPVTGTPQGGIISPILANIYLHTVLDVWFAEIVRTHCYGHVYLCRYADDFVCLFQSAKDAERFYKALIGQAELIQRTDRLNTGAIDANVLQKALTDADDEINGYLAKYLPLAVVPNSLERMACDIARYYLCEIAVPEVVGQRYKDTIKFLMAVGTGKLALIADDTGAIAPVVDADVGFIAGESMFSGCQSNFCYDR